MANEAKRFWSQKPKEPKQNPYEGTFLETFGRDSSIRKMGLESKKASSQPDPGPKPGF